MIFQSLLPASLSKPLTQNARTPPSNALFQVSSEPPAQHEIDSEFSGSQLVNENFSLSTWLLLGCSIQALLFLVVPARFQIYAYSFAGTLLLFRVLNAVLINFKVINNPYLQGGILKRTTALVADEAGSLVEPGKQGVTVLMLGAKSNHPFGFFAPEFLQTFAWVDKMNKEFDILEKMPKGCEFSCACQLKILLQHEQEYCYGAAFTTLLTIRLTNNPPSLNSSRPNILHPKRRTRRNGIHVHQLLAQHRRRPPVRPLPPPPRSLDLARENNKGTRLYRLQPRTLRSTPRPLGEHLHEFPAHRPRRHDGDQTGEW